MKRVTKVLTPLLTLALVIGSLSGCSTNKELITIRLNEVVRSIFYAPYYVAINKRLAITRIVGLFDVMQ